MKLTGVDLGLALRDESALGRERKHVHLVGQPDGLARAQLNGFDETQINDFGKGRAESRIDAESGSVIDDFGERECARGPHGHYTCAGVDRVIKWQLHRGAHVPLIGRNGPGL